jgi:hypothetical protein
VPERGVAACIYSKFLKIRYSRNPDFIDFLLNASPKFLAFKNG